MIATAIALGEAIRSHEVKSKAGLAGLTSLAAEEMRGILFRGPMVEVSLTVDDVVRIGEPGSSAAFKVQGRLMPDEPDGFMKLLGIRESEGARIEVAVEGDRDAATLRSLRPGDVVCGAGYATFGPPSPYGLSLNPHEHFVLSQARIVKAGRSSG